MNVAAGVEMALVDNNIKVGMTPLAFLPELNKQSIEGVQGSDTYRFAYRAIISSILHNSVRLSQQESLSKLTIVALNI
jgi:hypothetical protein